MKNIRRIAVTFILIISLAVTVLLNVYASSETLEYSASSNSGNRHVVCKTLNGTSADKYYTGKKCKENDKNGSENFRGG